MSGFFALLDDIATLAKLTLSTVDDTASMAVKTSAKVSAAPPPHPAPPPPPTPPPPPSPLPRRRAAGRAAPVP